MTHRLLTMVIVGAMAPPIADTTLAQDALVVVDYVPPPASLDSYWTSVAVVVRGTLDSRSVRANDRERPTVDTDHVLNVLEVLKDDGTVGDRPAITISDAGGRARVRDLDIRNEPGPVTRLSPKQEVVLFLKHSGTADYYVVAYGPNGLFVVDNGAAWVPYGVRQYKEFANKIQMSLDELRTVIQAARARP